MKIREQITVIFDMPEDHEDLVRFEEQNAMQDWYKEANGKSVSYTRSTYHLLLKETYRDKD